MVASFLDPTAVRTTMTGAETDHKHSVHTNTEVLSKFQNKSSVTL